MNKIELVPTHAVLEVDLNGAHLTDTAKQAMALVTETVSEEVRGTHPKAHDAAVLMQSRMVAALAAHGVTATVSVRYATGEEAEQINAACSGKNVTPDVARVLVHVSNGSMNVSDPEEIPPGASDLLGTPVERFDEAMASDMHAAMEEGFADLIVPGAHLFADVEFVAKAKAVTPRALTLSALALTLAILEYDLLSELKYMQGRGHEGDGLDGLMARLLRGQILNAAMAAHKAGETLGYSALTSMAKARGEGRGPSPFKDGVNLTLTERFLALELVRVRKATANLSRLFRSLHTNAEQQNEERFRYAAGERCSAEGVPLNAALDAMEQIIQDDMHNAEALAEDVERIMAEGLEPLTAAISDVQ